MSNPREPERSTSSAYPVMGRVAVAVLTVLPLLPTLRAQFVYDDTTVIRDNALLRGWDALWRVWTSPYWPADGTHSLGLYRPLQLMLLAFVWNLGSGTAIAFHVYALMLAIAASFSLWWMTRRAVAGVPALTAALLFAAHPLHVEAVASVANTSELVVLIATIGMVRLLWGTTPQFVWYRALGLAVLAAAALAAKESGLFALPIALVSAWGWQAAPSRESLRAYVGARLRYCACAAVAVAVVIAARLVVLGAAVSTGSIAAQGLDRLNGAGRVLAMMSLWPRIGAMVLWPSSLAPYYGPTLFPQQRVLYALCGLLLVVAVAVLAWRAARHDDRRPMVALAWMILSYLPAANLLTPTGQILSDRTLFGVTAGAALLAAWALDIASFRVKRVARVAFIILLAHSLLVGSRYAAAWTTHRTLWAQLAEVEPDEHMTFKLLGMDARGRGDNARAVAYLSRALGMTPTDRQIRFELGQAQISSGDHASAVRTLTPLLKDSDVRTEPQFVAVYLDAVGRSAGAGAVVAAARPLVRSESGAVASLFLGAALEMTGDFAAADSAYANGLQRAPRDSALSARLRDVRARRAH